ncbi:hypothetical protein Cgig2_022828 [Carnegiea gigantea]|uniref:Uncharacterized protein n=1 Tax=Carnegiea gigantea TaxID=171969 RepID=A0A9Q1KQI6_9CARY|nr:hypothetical protein Cgig2_022828 [Carnegiea gigantea]
MDLQPHSSLSPSPSTSPYPDLHTGTRGAEEDGTATSHPVPFPLFCDPPSPSISPSTTPFLDLQYTRRKLRRSKPKHQHIGATLLKPVFQLQSLPTLVTVGNYTIHARRNGAWGIIQFILRVLSSHRDSGQNFEGVEQVIGASCVVVITGADTRLCMI